MALVGAGAKVDTCVSFVHCFREFLAKRVSYLTKKNSFREISGFAKLSISMQKPVSYLSFRMRKTLASLQPPKKSFCFHQLRQRNTGEDKDGTENKYIYIGIRESLTPLLIEKV